MPNFFIVGYVIQILGRGPFCHPLPTPTPLPSMSSPKKAYLWLMLFEKSLILEGNLDFLQQNCFSCKTNINWPALLELVITEIEEIHILVSVCNWFHELSQYKKYSFPMSQTKVMDKHLQ